MAESASPGVASPAYRGLTWDHPRGKHALRAASEHDATVSLEWDVHPLEGFESAPIADLARRYDLIVLDHPHLGEALAADAFVPLGELFGTAFLDDLSADAVGPSFRSYALAGEQWALPLDAATQTAAMRIDLLERAGAAEAPGTWGEVVQLAERVPVALSLAGPHAFLTFASVCAGAGIQLADEPGAGSPLLPGGDADVARAAQVLELLRTLARSSPPETHTENPIALLERLRGGHTGDGGDGSASLAYIPLIYGYVTASSPRLQFRDAPRWENRHRRGSTIGGTGIAISRRCTITPELVRHLEWLLSAEAQRAFIPQHDGQPSRRSAWLDADVDRAAHGFYLETLQTIEDSWVRPRYDGFIAFQADASALLRACLLGGLGVADCLDQLEARFRASGATHPQPAAPRPGVPA